MSRQVLTLPDIPAAFLTQSEGDLAYAPVVHNHDGTYSSVGHAHDGVYSPTAHNHNGVYSPVAHTHDGTYAPTVHDHDARYFTETEADARFATASHNHNAAYAPIVHAHDAAYVNVGGDGMTGNLAIRQAASAVPLTLDRPDAATYLPYLTIDRQGQGRKHIGLGPGDELIVYSGDLSKAMLTISDTVVSVNAKLNQGNWMFGTEGTNYVLRAPNNDICQYWSNDGQFGLVQGYFRVSGASSYVQTYNSGIQKGGSGAFDISAMDGMNLQLNPYGGFVHPPSDNSKSMGHPGLRWNYTYTVNLKSDYCQAGGDAGQNVSLNYHQIVKGGGDHIQVAGTQYFEPAADNYCRIGGPANRWTVVYAANGGIQTSHVSGKYDLATLDPGACAEAVLGTDWLSFMYLAPVKIVGFPGETPEQDAQRVADHARMVEESLLYRRQNGYALGSENYKVHDLFGLADRRSVSTQSDLAIVACALQNALTRIAQLEAKV